MVPVKTVKRRPQVLAGNWVPLGARENNAIQDIGTVGRPEDPGSVGKRNGRTDIQSRPMEMKNPVEFIFQFRECAMRWDGDPEDTGISLEVFKGIHHVLGPAKKPESFSGQAQRRGKGKRKFHKTYFDEDTRLMGMLIG